MSDRERMLKELNLYPLWVLRNPPAEARGDAAAAGEESATALPSDARGAAPSVPGLGVRDPADALVAEETARSIRAVVPADSSSTARPTAGSAPGAGRPDKTSAGFATPSALVTRPTGEDEGRARAIAGMEWPALKEAVRACTACPLHAQRKQSVFGVGDEAADWLFIGEGPGADEDARGEPFVGQAGRLLDNMLASIGLARGQDVYIANVVKCRPPGNRVPEPVEARCCEPFLHRQIALLRPRLIVALGKTAADNLMRREASIASQRGRLHDYNGINLIVTYHPAYLLRNLPDKAKAWEDLCFARDTMQRLKSADAGAI